MHSRRNFLFRLAVSVAAPAALCGRALAQTPPVNLEESDPVATALGYKEDTNKVDATKYAQHKADQKCTGCVLYTGKADDASGPCSAFGGKLVTADGWCVAFAKKPDPVKP